MTSLLGIHDIEAAGSTPQGTWIVDTLALSESPPPKDYRHAANGLNVIVRANWGYGSTGTLPTPGRYGEYVGRLLNYVRGSHGCHRWIIGNECNLSREWPNGQPIMPWEYAICYESARDAVHALPGHEQDEVLVAASGPWNDDLTYAGNERGDWVQYTLDCLRPLGADVDGVALHAYCHGYDPALASSTARMNPPFQDRYYNFLTFTDYLRAMPAILAAANFYITEANGDGPWRATGLIPAMLAEVDKWNHDMDGAFAVKCMIAYRYPAYDPYYMQGKTDVMAEYVSATHLYDTPSFELPSSPPGTGEPDGGEGEPPRDIDPRLLARGVVLTPAKVSPGQNYWRVTKAEWLPDAANQVGPDHHGLGLIMVGGVQKPGVPIWVDWPSGSTTVYSKADDPNASFNWDYAMAPSLNEYSFTVADGNPSDKVSGVGMGVGGNPGAHSSTWISWSLVTAQEPVVPVPPLPPVRTKLIWPCVGPVTQWFGDGGPQWGMPGHNGIDIAVREGTPVLAIADGEVAYVGFDINYGNYCRVWHKQIFSHAFFAHLSEIDVQIGQPVKQGDTLGASGNTGAGSRGPHLHFELRGCDETGEYVKVTVGYFNGRYNPVDAYLVTGSPVSPA